MSYSNFLDWIFGERGQMLVAGGAGATASVLHKWPGTWPALRQFTIGFMVAGYFGPTAVPIFKWLFNGIDLPADHGAMAGVFAVGATGVILFEFMIASARSRVRSLKVPASSEDKGGSDDEVRS